MTVVISGGDLSCGTHGNGTAMTVSMRSASRSKGLRQSTTRIRSSGSQGTSSHSQGGQPMAGVDSNKIDIKHRFEITGKLGSGTYGKVSLAYDHKTEREVAVKLIKKSAIENKQDLVRIRREIRIMSMLKHPNIIQIYEVFENKDKIILVMEYANGGELYDYVSKFGSLPEAEARRIFRQITSAVLYCHKHKVAHRDLKLENILLDSRNNAKIADFGLSNYFNDKNLLATFCGSPLYASPEIINGTPYKGPEVDCWSLGILLYTLVYGSMPFDGRDFNRMVRQIKRGAYYEPDTPSTASMLIRNMLRVNPERRADIDDIASHWWLNLEENMPVIQELPENQITDHTPLTERAEIMVVQDLADETDVFMEFGHLSATTRQKIEEFRRRRKEAEEYNDNSPVKPPKHRRTSLKGNEPPEMSAKEKSLRGVEETKPIVAPATKIDHSTFQDPLDRLRQLESRLQGGTPVEAKCEKVKKASIEENIEIIDASPVAAAVAEAPQSSTDSKQKRKKSLKKERQASTDGKPKERKEDNPSTSKQAEERRPAFISPTVAAHRHRKDSGRSTHSDATPSESGASASEESTSALEDVRQQTRQYWKMGTDSLNLLMNQVLEQMEKGPVSLNLIARIKAHAFYDQRPMVKELLESIISAQPPSVQKETSKIIQQQSQELIRRQGSNKGIVNASGSTLKKAPMDTVPETKTINTAPVTATKTVDEKPSAQEKYTVVELPNQTELKRSIRKVLDDRPWHSVEVGFSTDDETSSNNTDSGGAIGDVAVSSSGRKLSGTAPKFIGTRTTRSEPCDEFDLDDEEEFYDDKENDDEEEYESDIDELADEVEQTNALEGATDVQKPEPPRIMENLAENLPPLPTAAGNIDPNHLSTLERGLAKRQSKGKYQFLHNQVEMYGRGVSMEAESPPVTRRRIGGPQPRVEQLPLLFDKAKNYLINYPDKIDDSDTEKSHSPVSKKNAQKSAGDSSVAWLQTRDPSVSDNKSTSSAVTTAPHSQEDISQKPSSDESEEKKKSEKENDEKDADNGDEDEEEEEEEETDDESSSAPFRPRPSTIIGFRTIQPIGADGIRKEAPIVKVKPQTPSNPSLPVKKYGGEFVGVPPKSAMLDSARRGAYDRRDSGAGSGGDSFDGNGGNDDVPAVGERQKHESASAYIRRKNRERRARNQTIAVAVDEAWNPRSTDNQENHYPDDNGAARRKSSFGGRLSIERSLENENGAERRPSYLEERRYEPNYLRQAYVDRRKSYHEITPSRAVETAEQRCLSPFNNTRDVPGGAYDRYGVSGYNALGGNAHLRAFGIAPPAVQNMSRFEEEILHAFYPNSALHNDSNYGDPSHRRFEVYRTRAERATDSSYNHRNSGSVTNTSGYYHGGERPSSAYVSDSYRPFSRYDDATAISQRRSLYDTDRPITPGLDYANGGAISYGLAAPPDSPNGSTGSTSNGRSRLAAARRMTSTSRDDTRRLRARSQSNDRMLAVMRDDIDTSEALFNSRLVTPEVSSGAYDHGYVGYHDTGRPSGVPQVSRGEVDLSLTPNRSILKNKLSFDSDVRPSYFSTKDSAASGGVKNVYGQLRRHLSTNDPTNFNFSMTTQFSDENELPTTYRPSSRTYTSRTSSFDEGTRHSELTSLATSDATSGNTVSSAQKKRSFLNLARRRTTEVTANLILADDDYKRPRSPINRLKSLFRPGSSSAKKDNSRDVGGSVTVSSASGYGSSSAYTSGSSGTSRYSSALTTGDVGSGYSSYTPSAATKRYTGALTNRYGFSGGGVSSAKSSPRSWYDDPHHY